MRLPSMPPARAADVWGKPSVGGRARCDDGASFAAARQARQLDRLANGARVRRHTNGATASAGTDTSTDTARNANEKRGRVPRLL